MSQVHASYRAADEVSEKGSSGNVHATVNDAEHHEHHFTRAHRDPGQMEIGIANIVQDRPDAQRTVVAAAGLSDSEIRAKWEQTRPELFIALFAEVMGVMFYVSFGGFALATLLVTTYAQEPQGSLFTVALCYAMGIAFAIQLAAPCSGGHLNPGVTVSLTIFKGFPVWKAPLYILAQLLGGLIAGFLVMACWKDDLLAIAAGLTAEGKGAVIYSVAGPAGALALFPTPGRSYSAIFATEWIADFLIAVVIATHLDSTNPFVSPVSAPFAIGFVYLSMILGLASGDLATNTARDLPTRMVCAVYFNAADCFPPKYSALTALTNIFATFCGFGVQQFLLSDTRRPPAPLAQSMHLEQEKAKHDLYVRTHERLLDERIQAVVSRGGDASRLEAIRAASRAH